MATFLVTGGCGFIGSHLCAALWARGDEVRVLDDLSTGHESNLAPGAELWRGDVADPDTIQDALAGVDGCFHLAAIASVERGVREWRHTHRVNLSATVGLLDAVARSGARIPVVYASSAAVYGAAEEAGNGRPLAENALTRPLSAYGADKLGCELHARVAATVHGIPTAGLRFFNVFGPRQDPRSPYSGVISIFCDRLRDGRAVEIFGDGEQTRDFVFVADVVTALCAAMRRASAATDAGLCSVLNVCTGRPTSVRQLASLVAELCGTPLEAIRRPPRAGEIRHSLGSPSRALEELRLAPPVELRAGLEEVLAWLRAGRPGLAAPAPLAEQTAYEQADAGPEQQ